MDEGLVWLLDLAQTGACSSIEFDLEAEGGGSLEPIEEDHLLGRSAEEYEDETEDERPYLEERPESLDAERSLGV